LAIYHSRWRGFCGIYLSFDPEGKGRFPAPNTVKTIVAHDAAR
jgi:hypothetical protein